MKTKTDKKLFDRIIKEYSADKKVRDDRELPEMWEKYEKYYRNDYWQGSGRPSRLSRLTSNVLFECVEAMLPVVVSRPPMPEVVPEPNSFEEGQSDYAHEYAKQVQRELIKVWDKTDMMSKTRIGYREHSIKGNFILKSTWDFEKEEINNECLDLLTIFPDKNSTTIKECEETHLTHASYVPVGKIKRIYDVEVDPEGDFDMEGNFTYYNSTDSGGGISGAVNRLKGIMSTGEDKKDGYALVLEYYCNDMTMEDYEDNSYDDDGTRSMDEDGNPKQEVKQRQMFPNGKKVVTIIRNMKNQIIREESNPYGRLPFFMTINYPRQGDFWGISDGQNVENHIQAINQAMSNRNDNLRYIGNPITEILDGSNIEAVQNEPGTVYRVAQPNSVRHISPPVMGGDGRYFVDDLRTDADRILGMSDAFRGFGAPGDSGVKTQTLISQATGRLQPKVQSFIDFSKAMYDHWAFLMQNFYPDMVQRIEDEQGIQYENFQAQAGADIKLVVDVTTTSMLPFDKYAEFQEAQQLYQMVDPDTQKPLISSEHLIDLAPSLRDKQRAKDHVSLEQEKMQQQMQQQAQAEQQAQQEQQPNPDTGLTAQEDRIIQSGDEEGIKMVLDQHPELAGGYRE